MFQGYIDLRKLCVISVTFLLQTWNLGVSYNLLNPNIQANANHEFHPNQLPVVLPNQSVQIRIQLLSSGRLALSPRAVAHLARLARHGAPGAQRRGRAWCGVRRLLGLYQESELHFGGGKLVEVGTFCH